MTKTKRTMAAGSVVERPHQLYFSTSQECWEKLNEYFITKDCPDLFDFASSSNSGLLCCYNVFISIKKAWVDPEFDYYRMFDYTISKWTSLLNNYLNLNKLDLLRSRIRYLNQKYNQNYNLTYCFSNRHDNGKGCLISVTFSRRLSDATPVLTAHLRSSEITKRLIFDLLLIQRMGEYVYGEGVSLQLNLFFCQMYNNPETLCMYHSFKDINPLVEQCTDEEWKSQLKRQWDIFSTNDTSKFTYGVYKRIHRCLRRDLYMAKQREPLLAKDLTIGYSDIEYPEDCITFSQRQAYKKAIKNTNKTKSKE